MKSLFRPFPLPLTGKQWFYLLFLQGFGAGLIDGGINFAIAYVMYHKQDVVRLWVFKENTIAGDLGVTPIITCAVSMLITSTLVHTDLHHHAIAPLPFVYPHVEHLPDPRLFFGKHPEEPQPSSSGSDNLKEKTHDVKTKHGISYYYWMLIRFIFEGTEKNMLLARIPVKNWFGRLLWTAAQGAGIGIIFGLPVWCLAIVIIGPIYGNGNLGSKWAPQVIKLIYGAIIGWLTNPVIATLALGSQAECHLMVVEHDPEVAVDENGVPTIPEEEADQPPNIPQISPMTPPRAGRRNTRSGSAVPSLHLTPSRNAFGSTRSRSSTGSRPPLTADCTQIVTLASFTQYTATATPERPYTLPRGTSAPSLGRIRSISVSGPPPPSLSGSESSTSLTYALGGTGGRAKRQRPRASTSSDGTRGLSSAPLPTMSEGLAGHVSPARTPMSAPLSRPSVRGAFSYSEGTRPGGRRRTNTGSSEQS